MRCPVCGFESGKKDESCGKCGTDFSLFATKDEVEEIQVITVKGNSKKSSNKPNRR